MAQKEWVTIPILDPEPVAIPLTAKTINGKRFGVGRCVVMLFGARITAVAAIAGDKKHINERSHIGVFLEQNGLPADQVETFIDEGLAEWDRSNK